MMTFLEIKLFWCNTPTSQGKFQVSEEWQRPCFSPECLQICEDGGQLTAGASFVLMDYNIQERAFLFTLCGKPEANLMITRHLNSTLVYKKRSCAYYVYYAFHFSVFPEIK